MKYSQKHAFIIYDCKAQRYQFLTRDKLHKDSSKQQSKYDVIFMYLKLSNFGRGERTKKIRILTGDDKSK